MLEPAHGKSNIRVGGTGVPGRECKYPKRGVGESIRKKIFYHYSLSQVGDYRKSPSNQTKHLSLCPLKELLPGRWECSPCSSGVGESGKEGQA